MAITYVSESLVRRGGTNLVGATQLSNFDSSYPTGGYTINASDFSLNYFTNINVEQASGYVIQADIQSGGQTAKLKVFAAAVDAGSIGNTTATNSSSAVTLGGSALTPTLNGFTGTTAGNVTTVTGGGAVVVLNALAGATITDGTVETVVISNTALTATSGTITTVTPLSAVITATGVAYVLTGTAAAQIQAAHNHSFTGSGAAALAEVSNGTNLSSVTGVMISVEGR